MDTYEPLLDYDITIVAEHGSKSRTGTSWKTGSKNIRYKKGVFTSAGNNAMSKFITDREWKVNHT